MGGGASTPAGQLRTFDMTLPGVALLSKRVRGVFLSTC